MLVKDINPGSVGSDPGYLTNVERHAVLRGRRRHARHGAVEERRHRRRHRPGQGHQPGTAALPSYLTNVNGTLFFAADDGTHGGELWKSDGTAAGTVAGQGHQPGQRQLRLPYNLTNVNGTLFFAADDGTHGSELWKSDGTAAGTVLVKDINPGSG